MNFVNKTGENRRDRIPNNKQTQAGNHIALKLPRKERLSHSRTTDETRVANLICKERKQKAGLTTCADDEETE